MNENFGKTIGVVVLTSHLQDSMATPSLEITIALNKGAKQSIKYTFEIYKNSSRKHIPGAVLFEQGACVERTQYIPRNLPEPRSFQEYLRSLGVNQDSHVIVYDRDDGKEIITGSGPRIWFILRVGRRRGRQVGEDLLSIPRIHIYKIKYFHIS